MVLVYLSKRFFPSCANFSFFSCHDAIDVKLATYMFDRVSEFSRWIFSSGPSRHDHLRHASDVEIRTFLMGQLFGTVLDSTTLLVFLPVMFFFSPIMTAVVLLSCAR